MHSRWHGEGARDLGLRGGVKADDFGRLLEGRDLAGEVLVAHREGLSERRAGWDVTISPHKSVSLAALVGGDRRLLDAHDRAVARTVRELERHAQAWVRGGRDVETTGKVVTATFRHETSRALDPQLHSHCVVLNATKRADGEWRAIDARGLFRAQRLGNETYQAEMTRELKALGYQVEQYRDTREGRQRVAGIAGFREDHLKQFSSRSREIEKQLKAQGLRGSRHGERVTLSTRKAKEKGIDREALVWKWRTAARDASVEFPKWGPAKETPRELVQTAREAVRGAVDHLAERRTVFGLRELEMEALARGRDRGVSLDDVRDAIDKREDLVIADRGDGVKARVTTAQAVDQERALVALVERGKGRGPVRY